MSSVLVSDTVCVAETRVDEVPIGTGPAASGLDPSAGLARLRAEFPHWGFYFDPCTCAFVGVRGRDRLHVARSVASLRAAIEDRQ